MYPVVKPTKNTRQIQSMGVVANKPYFILFSDVHLNSLRTDSDYGFDTGTKLFDAAMQSIYDLMVSSNPPQFVLFTGDLLLIYQLQVIFVRILNQ